MAATEDRLHALDAVRGIALMLGVVFHATASFLTYEFWIAIDSQTTVVMDVAFFTLHIFRMTTFFLIAGFFGRMAFHKKGPRSFLIDRTKRIALPLVVFWPFALAGILGAIILVYGSLPQHLAPPPDAVLPVPLTHLWFLYVLLLLYAVTLAVRGIVALFDRGGDFRRFIDRIVSGLVKRPFAPVVLAAPLFAVFLTETPWVMLVGITTPDRSLIPTLGAAVGYSVAFGFGWLLHRQIDLLQVWRRRWLFNLAFAIALTIACFLIVRALPLIAPPATEDWRRVAYAAFYPLAIWTWVPAFIGFAMQFMASPNPTRRYIADSSYWIYIMHLPLVLALQAVMAPYGWPWFVKYTLILAISFAMLFASYQLLVRYTFIGTWLNGRRDRPPRVHDAAPAEAR